MSSGKQSSPGSDLSRNQWRFPSNQARDRTPFGPRGNPKAALERSAAVLITLLLIRLGRLLDGIRKFASTNCHLTY